MKKIKAAIVGASGYTGFELLSILGRHPGVEVICATSRKEAGEKICDMYPALEGVCGDMKFCEPKFELLKEADVAFTALPHTAGAQIGGELVDAGVKLIDLSADFRYDSLSLYEKTYGVTHPRPDLLKQAVYGLCELNREKIKSARLVGNPGCYTTAAILALYPLVKENLIEKSGIIIDGKSGVTGAGRKSDVGYSFCETEGNFRAYSAVGHRHTTEMKEKLNLSALSFTPHLLPVKRGILETIYAKAKTSDFSAVESAYEKYYGKEKFVSFSSRLPDLNLVRGSNCCRIGAVYDPECGLIKIVSVIDNLIKGASGQAVQNMNILFGFDEDTALTQIGEHL